MSSLRRAPTRSGTSSAEISNGIVTGTTPRSFDDSISLAAMRVLAMRIHTACIAGVPGLRWNVTSTDLRRPSTASQVETAAS